MSAKRIMIISPFNPDGIGGAETFLKVLMAESIKAGYIIELVTLDKSTIAWDEPSIWQAIKTGAPLAIKALKAIRKHNVETVVGLGLIGGSIAIMLKKLFKKKAIIILLALYQFGTYSSLKRAVIKWILAGADTIFVEDAIAKKDVINLISQDKDIKIFMHWIDIDIFKPPVKMWPRHLKVLFIGRPIHKKGKHIIEAAQKILQNRRIQFTYIENVPYEKLPGYYRKADIFVIPSIYNEGVARVVLEAAASGCVIISSDQGSLKALVEPFGIVIFPTGINFAGQIRRLQRKRYLLKEYQMKAREYAKAHFTNNNAKVIIDAY